jgi:hypothetical protein
MIERLGPDDKASDEDTLEMGLEICKGSAGESRGEEGSGGEEKEEE